MVAEIRRAVAWAWREGPSLGIDRDRLHIGGHSAGGHLAAMALMPAWAAEAGLPADVLKGGYSISGIYDLRPLRASYQQAALAISEETLRAAAPQTWVAEAQAPLFCAVGALESEEFLRQQEAFVAAGLAAGREMSSLVLPGSNHFSVIERLKDPSDPMTAAILKGILEA